jgi:hypothetical protein
LGVTPVVNVSNLYHFPPIDNNTCIALSIDKYILTIIVPRIGIAVPAKATNPPTNKTDCQDITEILLKKALNTITLTLYYYLLDGEW